LCIPYRGYPAYFYIKAILVSVLGGNCIEDLESLDSLNYFPKLVVSISFGTMCAAFFHFLWLARRCRTFWLIKKGNCSYETGILKHEISEVNIGPNPVFLHLTAE